MQLRLWNGIFWEANTKGLLLFASECGLGAHPAFLRCSLFCLWMSVVTKNEFRLLNLGEGILS